MLISIIDSYYSYVAKRLQVNGATVSVNGAAVVQPMGGIVDAHDWPEAPTKDGALYLIIGPMREGMFAKSKSQRQCIFSVQWTWLLIGTDIQPDEQAENRGDRYLANTQIASNLMEASFPGFCQKMDYSVNTETGVMSATPAMSAYPVAATERIIWDRLRFMPKDDARNSGVLYNAAATTVTGWEDISAAASLTFDDTRGAQILDGPQSVS